MAEVLAYQALQAEEINEVEMAWSLFSIWCL